VRQIARGIRSLRPELPLSVSCTTPTGRTQLASPPEIDAAFYAPLDFRGLPGRVLDAVRPAALVLVETELWPNLLREAADRGVPVVVVNGRLAPERMSRYLRLRALYKPLLETLHRVGAQSREDARRFAEIGVPEGLLQVTGNVKYDLPRPASGPEELRKRFGLEPGRPVLAAGSTGPGEDALVLDAFVAVRSSYPDAFLLLAPRHADRVEEASRLARARNLSLLRVSSDPGRGAALADGLLVDTVGELASLYGLARASFVGGSLVPVGGHNVLEPAAAGSVVLFGPHTHHVEDAARGLESEGGAVRVGDAAHLAREWTALLGDPGRAGRTAAAAERVLRRNGGALDRSVRLVLAAAGLGPDARELPA
jgi:3-deoxy-D-manno-octulosonic-acid transferase